MEKLVKVTKIKREGLVSLLGEKVILFCSNYFWAGTLAKINKTCVLLEDAGIVYETGNFADKAWKDFQKIGHPVYVQVAAIEAFTKGK